jgi:hypothetical protein
MMNQGQMNLGELTSPPFSANPPPPTPPPPSSAPPAPPNPPSSVPDPVKNLEIEVAPLGSCAPSSLAHTGVSGRAFVVLVPLQLALAGALLHVRRRRVRLERRSNEALRPTQR